VDAASGGASGSGGARVDGGGHDAPGPSDARPSDARPDGGSSGADSDKVCGAEGWCWISPIPQGNTLRGVWAGAHDDVWAVGDHGIVLRYDGHRWSQIPTGFSYSLTSVWGSGPNDVWIGGEQGLLLHDGGAGLMIVKAAHNGDDPIWAIAGTSLTDVWFADGTNCAGHWNGSAFATPAGPPAATTYAYSVYPLAPGEALVGTEQGIVAHAFYNASATFSFSANTVDYYTLTQVAPADTPLYALFAAQANDAWVGGGGTILGSSGNDGLLYHYTGTYASSDPGTTPKSVIHGIWGASASNVWQVGDAGAISHWNGSAWTALPAPTPFGLLSISGVAANDIWAVGAAGVMVHWDGVKWTPDARPTTGNLNDVWATAADDIWAVGDNGVIVRSMGNDLFAPVASPTTENLARIWGAMPTDLWMVGANGTVLEWDGTGFTPRPGPTGDLASIWGTSRKDIWVTGNNGALSHFDGSNWTTLPFYKASIAFAAVWTDDPDKVFVGGADIASATYDAIWVFKPSTNSWTETSNIQGTELVWGSGPTDVWTSGYPGDGNHWDGASWKYYRTDTLYALRGSGPGDVWGVGFYGVIVHHGAGDASGTWTNNGIEQNHMTNNDLLGVFGLDASRAWAVGKYGTILRKQQ
jgi:hypothetical protein